MSLILEALKKLERDKQAPDRGFLVVAHVPWAAKAQRGTLWLGIAAALLALALASVGYRLWPGGERPIATPAVRDDPAADAGVPVTVAPQPSPPLRSPAAAPSPASAPLPAASLPGPVRPTASPRAATMPAATPATSLPAAGVELRLNAISQRDGQWVAVLNDRLVREGDEFDGIRVVHIGEAEIEVEIAGRRQIVRF